MDVPWHWPPWDPIADHSGNSLSDCRHGIALYGTQVDARSSDLDKEKVGEILAAHVQDAPNAAQELSYSEATGQGKLGPAAIPIGQRSTTQQNAFQWASGPP